MFDWAKIAIMVVTAVIALWSAYNAKKSQEQARKAQEERDLKETEQQRQEDRVQVLAEKIDTMNTKLDGVCSDVSFLRTRVAVHDDRFNQRPLWSTGEDWYGRSA